MVDFIPAKNIEHGILFRLPIAWGPFRLVFLLVPIVHSPEIHVKVVQISVSNAGS
jgi:hypothetical protein